MKQRIVESLPIMRVHSYEEFFVQPFEPGRFWWTEPGVSLLLQWGDKRGEHLMVLHQPRAEQLGRARRRGRVRWKPRRFPTLSPSIGVLHEDGETWIPVARLPRRWYPPKRIGGEAMSDYTIYRYEDLRVSVDHDLYSALCRGRVLDWRQGCHAW